jgi:hypothetical protein
MANHREEATRLLIDSLKSRYPEKGFFVSPALKFCDSVGNGMRVIAQADVGKEETLLVIPEKTKLSFSRVFSTDAHSKLHKRIIQKCAPWKNEYSADDFALTAAVMHVLSSKSAAVQNDASEDEPFILQAATWPSEEAIRQDSMLYWDYLKVKGIWNQSYMMTCFDRHRDAIRRVFDQALFPLLASDASSFIDSTLPSNSVVGIADKDALWNTYLYAFSLVWSRTHGAMGDDPCILPLVELFNGNSDRVNEGAKKGKTVDKTIVNVAIALGKWPFIRGANFINECNLPCSSVYANRNIVKGEELIISYGDLSPVQFMLKYGAMPESLINHHNILSDVSIWCDPAFIPEDPLRVQCLKQSGGYPLEQLKTDPQCVLMDFLTCRDDPYMYMNGYEPGIMKSMRQFLTLAMCADAEELNRNVTTGRLRGHLYELQVLPLMCKMIDYNLELLAPGMVGTSEDDVKQAQKTGMPAWEKAALLARVAYRESLVIWRWSIDSRALFFQNERCQIAAHPCIANGGCNYCGRTYPVMKCLGCKRVLYCHRAHQIADRKAHKQRCGGKK